MDLEDGDGGVTSRIANGLDDQVFSAQKVLEWQYSRRRLEGNRIKGKSGNRDNWLLFQQKVDRL